MALSDDKTHSNFVILDAEYVSTMTDIQNNSMNSASNVFFKNSKNVNELVMRPGNKKFNEINVIIANADKSKRLPQANPFLVQDHVKKAVNRHESIENMKYTRQGKIQFTTKDPVCAVQLLNLEKFMDIDVFTNIIWENVTTTSLEVLAEEIQEKNECIITEMRWFVKSNSSKEISPVLVTILGTELPESVKIGFIHQRVQQFIDRPRVCSKCFSFSHPTRVCEKLNLCYICGETHLGSCQQPVKCINCQGNHNAKSTTCPVYIKEQKILELKCRNNITTGEARRILHNTQVKYSEAVKNIPVATKLEENIEAKFEALVQKMNEKFEKQMEVFANMMQKSIECIIQNVFKIVTENMDSGSSPARKKIIRNLNKFSGSFRSWDAGGSNDPETLPEV